MITNDGYKRLFHFFLWCIVAFIVAIVGISNVFAWDWTNSNGITYNAIGYITNDTDILIDVSYDTSSGAPLPVAVDQSVYTEIKTLYINLSNYTFLANTRYELELNLSDNKLVYANTYSVQGNNGEQCMISLSDSVFNDPYPRFDFQCPSATNQISISVYNSNNTSITTKGTFSWHYSHLYSSTMQINSSTTNNNDLITNANQNADRIIDNQNQNTEKEIESQKVCEIIDNTLIKDRGKFLNNIGNIGESANFGITDYINVYNSKIKTTVEYLQNTRSACFYDINKTLISCTSNDNFVVNSYINIPNNTYYMRFSIQMRDNKPQFEICKNGNQALNDSITGLNDSLNDDDSSGATSEASEFFSSFTTNTFGLTSIITAPLNLIQSLTSSTCSELHLPLPYLNNKYLDLPCMTTIYQTHFGAFFTMYQTITYGIIAYWVCVRIFNQVKDFKNPEHDEIEVVDL